MRKEMLVQYVSVVSLGDKNPTNFRTIGNAITKTECDPSSTLPFGAASGGI